MIQAAPIDFVVLVTYFLVVLGFGAWFGRFTKSTKDFFFGGQRFSWWIIAMSCVATVVGSYSFMKYSAAGYKYGLSSAMTYLNDWVILPFFILGWFPIIYFSRVTSIPEYFERRFDRKTRIAAIVTILIYMIGYVGINFFTLGVALQPLLNMNLYTIIIIVAIVSAVYMHAGGQTSVIMTDLMQGFVLLAAGFVLLFLGLKEIGGFTAFWDSLPAKHRFPLAEFNRPPNFNFVGIFWQDALASSVAFYFMNQGVMMRFMSVKSPREGYKAIFFVVLILMPLASLAIANSGWLGQSMVQLGLLDGSTVDAQNIFMAVASRLTFPGLFGLILAALTAALMSTIDTLITAISAVFINDIWKPFVVSDREDLYYLKCARWVAIGSTILGVLLVPIFAAEKSIYQAHGKFIATVTPAMIVVILLSVFWRRFNSFAAFWSLIIGTIGVGLVIYFPGLVEPIAHGVDPSGGFKYMRAFFGIVVTLVCAIFLTLTTKADPVKKTTGLVIDSIDSAKWAFKGAKPDENAPLKKVSINVRLEKKNQISVSQNIAEQLNLNPKDLVYLCDARSYLGGLRSGHLKVDRIDHGSEDTIVLSEKQFSETSLLLANKATLEKIM